MNQRAIMQHSAMRMPLLFAGAILCGFVGFALAMALNIAVPSADAGDWLAAGAGTAGVMLTIFVAVAIEQYRGKWRERADRVRVREVLAEFSAALEMIKAIPGWSGETVKTIEASPEWTGETKSTAQSLALQRGLLNAIAKYRFVRAKVEIVDLDLWEALEELDTAMSHLEPDLAQEMITLAREIIPRGPVGDTETLYLGNRRRVTQAAANLDPYVEVALRASKIG